MGSEFTENEKLELSSKIEEMYFNRNFGSMSKADFETLLFSEYIEHCINNEIPYDDYSLSKKLGITQSRIRSLKERKELKYPHSEELDWVTPFMKAAQNARLDKSDHYIKFIIEDINVLREVRHFIEEQGWYDECSFNSKLLRIPFECFTEICLKDAELSSVFSDDAKKRIKKLSNKHSEVSEFIKDFSKDGLESFLKTASKEIIKEVLSLLPLGGVVKIGIDCLIKAIDRG